MIELNEQTEIGQLVAERPSLARVLHRLGMDYCCGGRDSLSSACQARGLDLQAVISELAECMQSPPEKNLQHFSLAELTDHIVRLHHGYLRETLPILAQQVDRVAVVHGPGRPALVELRGVFRHFCAEMMEHLEKEEQVLFPLISEGQTGPRLSPIIEAMESEHESAGQDLAEMRRLTDGYAIPEGSCSTFRAVMQGLAELEEETHRHVHAENHVLFPRAVEAKG